MVRKLDLSNVKASSGDGFTPLPEGAYVVEIVAVNDVEDREYLEVTFDVAEGEYAGYYSDEWGATHPFAHQLKVSYKDAALGMLKGWLDVLTASNPGFDAEACFNGAADAPALLGMFQGRRFGLAVLNEYEDWKKKPLENPRLDWSNAKRLTAQSVREGSFTWQKRDERHTPKQPTAAAVVAQAQADEIPF